MNRTIPFALAALMALSGCVTHHKVMQVSKTYTYEPANRKDREWHALMQALDSCHHEGFKDATPSAKPAPICEERRNTVCRRSRVTMTYDCTGGYQGT